MKVHFCQLGWDGMGYLLRWDWNRTIYDRVRWDGSGYTLYYYYYSSLEPPPLPPPPFSKAIYVLCTMYLSE